MERFEGWKDLERRRENRLFGGEKIITITITINLVIINEMREEDGQGGSYGEKEVTRRRHRVHLGEKLVEIVFIYYSPKSRGGRGISNEKEKERGKGGERWETSQLKERYGLTMQQSERSLQTFRIINRSGTKFNRLANQEEHEQPDQKHRSILPGITKNPLKFLSRDSSPNRKIKIKLYPRAVIRANFPNEDEDEQEQIKDHLGKRTPIRADIIRRRQIDPEENVGLPGILGERYHYQPGQSSGRYNSSKRQDNSEVQIQDRFAGSFLAQERDFRRVEDHLPSQSQREQPLNQPLVEPTRICCYPLTKNTIDQRDFLIRKKRTFMGGQAFRAQKPKAEEPGRKIFDRCKGLFSRRFPESRERSEFSRSMDREKENRESPYGRFSAAGEKNSTAIKTRLINLKDMSLTKRRVLLTPGEAYENSKQRNFSPGLALTTTLEPNKKEKEVLLRERSPRRILTQIFQHPNERLQIITHTRPRAPENQFLS